MFLIRDMLIRGFSLLIALCTTLFVQAQRGFGFSPVLSGSVIAAEDSSKVSGARIEVWYFPEDSLSSWRTNFPSAEALQKIKVESLLASGLTDENGNYKLDIETEEMSKLRSKGVRFREMMLSVFIQKSEYEDVWNIVKPEMQRTGSGFAIKLGRVQLRKIANLQKLDAINIRTKSIEMNGDTTEINAGSFKVNPDASAEDLIAKMPGVMKSGGDLQAQGEKVQRVLVDGKPFFGEDPKAALKNVPADAISKVQIYDAQSEQSQFTGFDDGNTTKTINIITKMGFKTGQFGKIFAGAGKSIEGSGDDIKFQGGGSYNTFNGDRRLSILAQSNNINEQNFAVEDILGMMPSGGGRGGMRSMGDFFVNDQDGIVTSHMLGLNYSDKVGNWDISGSYFFGNSINNRETGSERFYIAGRQAGLTYSENSHKISNNINHRINGRLKWNINEKNKLILQPRVTIQANKRNDTIDAVTSIEDNLTNVLPISTLNNFQDESGDALNASLEIDYMHAFEKPGRSIAIEFIPSFRNRGGINNLANNLLLESSSSSVLTDQIISSTSGNLSYSTEIEFTEMIDSVNGIEFEYQSDFNQNSSERLNEFYDFSDYYLDTLLSNRYINGYYRHALGAQYQYKMGKWRMDVGAYGQIAGLDGDQSFPYPEIIQREFFNVLPRASIRYGDHRSSHFRLFYRTNTNAPDIQELQNVVDNSNLLQLSVGNPDLVQNYQHRVFLRYFSMSPESGKSKFLFGNFSITQNAFTNFTRLAGENGLSINVGDSTYVLNPGSQITQKVNMNGVVSAMLSGSIGQPLAGGKLNLNLGITLNYSQTPSKIQLGDGKVLRNMSQNPSASLNLGLGSNISEKIDFLISSSSSLSEARNTMASDLTSSLQQYFFQTTSFNINVMPLGSWVVTTDLSHRAYTGLDADFNQNFFLWNAAIGRKFGKKNEWDVRFRIFDILNQNRSINRSVTETYFEDVKTNVLTRYIMLNLTYNIRNLKGGSDQEIDPMRVKMIKYWRGRHH